MSPRRRCRALKARHDPNDEPNAGTVFRTLCASGLCAIDDDRIYLTGLSMGGFAMWRWAGAEPERFAAAIPI